MRRSRGPLKNVFCLGLNYAAHAQESAAARDKADANLPEIPVFFIKAPTTVNGPFDDIPVDAAVTAQVDWEVELGVIIGTHGQATSAARDALAHVFGYTVINDVSARDLQMQHTASGSRARASTAPARWARSSSPPTSSATRRPSACSCRVNGVIKQDATHVRHDLPGRRRSSSGCRRG